MKGKIVYARVNRYYIDGVEVTREAFDLAFPTRIKDLLKKGPPAAPAPSAYPKRSVALACHPDQVAELNARQKKLGLANYHEADGTMVVMSRAEQAAQLKEDGLYNKDGGYGD